MGFSKQEVELMQAACGTQYIAGLTWSMLTKSAQDIRPPWYGEQPAEIIAHRPGGPSSLGPTIAHSQDNRRNLFGTIGAEDWVHSIFVPPPGSKKYGRMYAITSDLNKTAWHKETSWTYFGSSPGADDGLEFLSQRTRDAGSGPPNQGAPVGPGGIHNPYPWGTPVLATPREIWAARQLEPMRELLDQWKAGFTEPFYLHETSYNNGVNGVANGETKRVLSLDPAFNWPYHQDIGSPGVDVQGLEVGGFWYEEHASKPWAYVYLRYNPVQFYPRWIREHWHNSSQPIPTGNWEHVRSHSGDPIGKGGWLMRVALDNETQPLPPAQEICRCDSRAGEERDPPPIGTSEPGYNPAAPRRVEQGGITVWVPTGISNGIMSPTIITTASNGREDSEEMEMGCEITSRRTGHILATTDVPDEEGGRELRMLFSNACQRFQFHRRSHSLSVVRPVNDFVVRLDDRNVPAHPNERLIGDRLDYLTADGSDPEEWTEGITVRVWVEAMDGSFAQALGHDKSIRFLTDDGFYQWSSDLHIDSGAPDGDFHPQGTGTWGRPRIAVGGLNGCGHIHMWAKSSDDPENTYWQPTDNIGPMGSNRIADGNDTLVFEADLSAPCQITKCWSMAKNGNNEFMALYRPTEFTNDATEHNNPEHQCFAGNGIRLVSSPIMVHYLDFDGDFIGGRERIGDPLYGNQIPGVFDPDPLADNGGYTPMWDTGYTGGKHPGHKFLPFDFENNIPEPLFNEDAMLDCSFYEPHLTSYRDTPDIQGYIVANHAYVIGRGHWQQPNSDLPNVDLGINPGTEASNYRIWTTNSQTWATGPLARPPLGQGIFQEWQYGGCSVAFQGNKTANVVRPTDNNLVDNNSWVSGLFEVLDFGSSEQPWLAQSVQMLPTHRASDTHETTINPAKLPVDPDHEDDPDDGPGDPGPGGPFSIYVTPRTPSKKPYEYDEPNCRCPVVEPDTNASAIVDLCRDFPTAFTSQAGHAQQRPLNVLTIRWDDDGSPTNYIDVDESAVDNKVKRILDLQNYGLVQSSVLDWGSVAWTLGEGAVGKADSATVTLSGRDVYDRMTATMGQGTVAELSVVYDEGSSASFDDRATYFSGRLIAPIEYDLGADVTTITIESILGNLRKAVGKLADPLVFTGISDVYADRALPIAWGCARRVEAILVDQPWETKSLFDEAGNSTTIEITDHPDDMGATPGISYDAFYGSHRVVGEFTQSTDKTNTPSTFLITSEESAVFATGIVAYMQPNGDFDLSNRYVIINMDDLHPGGINWVDVFVVGQTFGVFHTSELSSGYATYQISAVEYHQPYRNHVRINLAADTTAFQAGDAIEFIDPAAIRSMLQSGTGLVERGDSANWAYIANMLPSEKVVRVEGHGITLDSEGFGTEGFIPIGRQTSPIAEEDAPTYHLSEENYTVNLSDSTWFGALGHNVTTVNFQQRPRRMHKRLRSDRIWVTLQGSKYNGTFTSNPVRMIQEYLGSAHLVGLEAAQIDEDSFAAAALVTSGFRLGFAQTATQDAWELLSGLASQCHSVLQVDAGVVRIVVLRNSVGNQALAITEDHLIDDAITIEETHIDDVASHVYATYRRTWDDLDTAFETASHELTNVTNTIGRNVQELSLDLYPCRKVVDAETKFWLNRWGVIYQDVTVEMGLAGLCLRPGDWLHVSFTELAVTLVDELLEIQAVTFTPGGIGSPPTCQITGRGRLHEFD